MFPPCRKGCPDWFTLTGSREPLTVGGATGGAEDGHRRTERRDLLRALVDDDRNALAELYHRHSAWLVIRLSRRCADPDVVDQAVQDTFVAMWRKPGRTRARARRRPGSGASASGGSSISSGGGRRRCTGRRERRDLASAEEQALLGVEHGGLAGAMDRLSPELRAVVQATVLDGSPPGRRAASSTSRRGRSRPG